VSTAGPRHRDGAFPRAVALTVALVAGLVLAAAASLTSSLGTIGATGSHARAVAAPAQESPERSVETLLQALGDGDVARACTVTAPDGLPMRSERALSRCEHALGRMLDGLDPRLLRSYRHIDVHGAVIDGDSATVEPRHLADAPVAVGNATFVLVRVGGAWFVVV